MTVAVAAALSREARADQEQPVARGAFLDDQRFVNNRVAGPAFDGGFESRVPVELAVAFENRGVGHRRETLRRQVLQQRRFAQMDPEAILAIQAFDMAAKRVRATHQIAQPLPADFDERRVGFRDHRGSARTAREGRQFAEDFAAFEDDRIGLVERPRNVLQKDARARGLAALGRRMGRGRFLAECSAHFREARTSQHAPERGPPTEFAQWLAAKRFGRKARKDDAHAAPQDEKRAAAVVPLADNDVAGRVMLDANVVAQEVAQRQRWRKPRGVHAAKRLDLEQPIDVGNGHLGAERLVPPLRPGDGDFRVDHE
jgi:hypothetical protein